MAINSFADIPTERFFKTGKTHRRAGWDSIKGAVRRKLDMLHYAARLEDLNAPPGNRLEALRGELAGYYSIRVSRQWRIVFQWTPLGPTEVRICDYH